MARIVVVIAPPTPDARAEATTKASKHHAVTSSTAAQAMAMAPSLLFVSWRSARIRASTGNAVMLIAAPRKRTNDVNFTSGGDSRGYRYRARTAPRANGTTML